MNIEIRSMCLSLSIGTLFLISSNAFSGISVIVHPDNANTLSPSEISRIFLGKKRSFPDGSESVAVDQAEGSDIRKTFVSGVLKKNEQQIKAYWAQLLFTGKGTPPQESMDVKSLIAENPSFIGYIDSSKADSSVKVIHTF